MPFMSYLIGEVRRNHFLGLILTNHFLPMKIKMLNGVLKRRSKSYVRKLPPLRSSLMRRLIGFSLNYGLLKHKFINWPETETKQKQICKTMNAS